jgi:DNA-directed RNA polymerase specialized sigma24 family protein
VSSARITILLHKFAFMTLATRLPSGDPRLASFLEAGTDDQASTALEQVLGGDVARVIQQTVRRELGRSSVGAGQVEDVVADVRLRMVRKLWSLKRDAGESIDNLLGYAATAAEYTCYAFLRVQYPERTRFRNRLRYAVGHLATTTLRRDEAGIWRCETRRAVRRAPAVGATQAFIDDPRTWLASLNVDAGQPLPALADAVLARLDGAIELDRLVDALALVLGIADARPAGRHGQDELPDADRLPDPAPGVNDVLEHRQALERTWTEITALPARQRAALLLNLRDPDGGAILHMLPATGVVSNAAIAAALELSPATLAALWDRLPLDDLSIASELDLTRQQVINLRKSARARLARRLRESAS